MHKTPPSALLLIIFSLSLSPLSFGGANLIAYAEVGEGTLIIEQKDTEYFGEWGLATPVGVVEGESERFSSKKAAGNYALTVTPPAGAIPKIEVFNDGVLTESFDTRTANGILGSGGTLQFTITYDFALIGNVSVTSTPGNIRFELKGPREVERGSTPASYMGVPEGNYTVYFKPPKPCVFPRPLARNLKPNGRISFDFTPACLAEKTEKRTVSGRKDPRDASARDNKEERKEEQEEEERTPRRRSTLQSPIRVSASTASAEVAVGGRARLSIAVLNRGDEDLKDLTVNLTMEKTTVSNLQNGGSKLTSSSARWTISELKSGQKWETSVSVQLNEDLRNGDTVIANVTISGDALQGVRSSQRSASARIGAIKVLPETGVPLDLLILLLFALGSVGILGFGTLRALILK